MSEQAQQSIFGERLRENRERLQLSQHELARLCGLGVNQISRYETGVQEPSFAALKKLSEILGTSIDYLAGKVDNLKTPNSQEELNIFEREIIEMFRREGWSGVARLSVERLSK